MLAPLEHSYDFLVFLSKMVYVSKNIVIIDMKHNAIVVDKIINTNMLFESKRYYEVTVV